jgi:hypothetical protein
LGLRPDDPLAQSPVSVALLPPAEGSSDVIDALVLLHSSQDEAAIRAKVREALGKLGYDSSNSTVNGVQVTKVNAPNNTTVYYTVLGHDLVFSYDTEGLSQAIDTFQGKTSSLASSSVFKQVISQGPKTNAVSLFVSLDNLAKAPGDLGNTYRQLVKQNDYLAKVRADYAAYHWDDSGITIVEDVALK